jgi:UPF0176 protein
MGDSVNDHKVKKIYICSLYKFVTLDDYTYFRQPLLNLMKANHIKGTLILAQEGINGTVSGTENALNTLLKWLRADRRLKDIGYHISYHETRPFHRCKVKLKNEIVSMGIESVDPRQDKGQYVSPEQWNQLLEDPEVMVIDTRNEYETQIGTFKNAINPNTRAFREFPDYADKYLSSSQYKKVAMFCTGGIRCEKSTAYLKQKGFEEVYHLKGGILNYLKQMPEDRSKWYGECFVFDNRVAVDHDLQKGQYDQCFACRRPITDQDKQSHKYAPGVSCPHCYDQLTIEQMERFKERQRQTELARQRGEPHIGMEVNDVIQSRYDQKYNDKTG